MATAVAYDSYSSGYTQQNYAYSGLNNENAFASYVSVPNGFWCDTIWVFWAGRGGTAYGFHCIWDVGTGAIIANSGTVTATAGTDSTSSSNGMKWYSASITPIYLAGGKNYYVGCWCNPSYPRYTPQFSNGTVTTSLYRKTALNGPSDGIANNTAYTGGVLAVELDGHLPNNMKVNNAGAWTSSKDVWVNNGGVWTKSKQIWVNNNGTWTRSS